MLHVMLPILSYLTMVLLTVKLTCVLFNKYALPTNEPTNEPTN